MIITLIGADFSSKNIGTLSTWSISRVLGSGATYSGATYVDRGAALSATVTIADGYDLGSAGVSVTMGGSEVSGAYSISGNVITISIASVTGTVVIKVPTVNTSTGEEDGSNSGDTSVITPTVTTWYTEYATGSANDGTNIAKSSYAGFTYQGANNNYVGKTINAVRLRVAQAGTMTIGVASSDRKTVTNTQTITLANPSTTEVQIYMLSTPIVLTSDQALVFGASTDAGLFYYKEAGSATASNGERMWHHVPSAPVAATSTASLTVDAGYVVE